MTDERTYPVRLIGGPYDGDSDQLDVLPPELWAFTCACDSRCTDINGIHWAYGADLDDGADEPAAARYVYSYPDHDGHAYRWDKITSDRDGRRLREAIHA